MKIQFYPQRNDIDVVISVSGDIITINGEEFDLSPIGEGETLPHGAISSDIFLGSISRVDEALELGFILPLKNSPHKKLAFPEDVVFTEGVLVDTVNGIYPWSLD